MITQQQFESLIRLVQDERSPIDMDAVEALHAMHSTVEKIVIKRLIGSEKRNSMLQERLEKYKERDRIRVEEGNFGETELRSDDVAKALLYQLQQLRTYRLNDYKLQAILYEMYASWLESKKERLFDEHPVATPYGPRFWRVFKNVKAAVKVSYDDWTALAEKNPGVAAFCRNAANKYYDTSEGELSRMYLKSKPYTSADKDHNGGKWNKEMDDRLICAWKAEKNNRK